MTARAQMGIYPVDQQVCPGDTLYLGIGENFDQWYAQLKSQSPCSRNTCTLSCRTRNTGAQVCGPTSRKWNSIGCHPVNNTAIFPSVSYGFAAHIDLLRQYCGTKGRCTIASAIQMWAPASDGNNPTSYAATVSRWAGVPANQVFNPNDIDLMGRIALAMSCVEAGSLPYSVDDLKQGLAMAGGGAKVPVPQNVGQLLQDSLTGNYAPNTGFVPNPQPLGLQTFPPPTSMTPYTYTSPPANAINPTQNSPLIPPLQTTPTSNPVTNTSPGPYSANSSAPIPGAGAALNLEVWPHTLVRGQTLLVYWTSVNMQQNSCQVLFQNQQLAQSNEGVKPFKTTSFDPGTLSFTLNCTDANGQLHTSRDSATLQ